MLFSRAAWGGVEKDNETNHCLAVIGQQQEYTEGPLDLLGRKSKEPVKVSSKKYPSRPSLKE